MLPELPVLFQNKAWTLKRQTSQIPNNEYIIFNSLYINEAKKETHLQHFQCSKQNFRSYPLIPCSFHRYWDSSLILRLLNNFREFEGFLIFHGEGLLKILPFKMKGYFKKCSSHMYYFFLLNAQCNVQILGYIVN